MLKESMNASRNYSVPNQSVSEKDETPDRPEDAEWNWSEIYATEISHRYLTCGYVTHLRIYRRDGKEIVANWDLLQRIKTDILGDDTIAVEFYPPEIELVNEVNMRHLWVFPESVIPREYLPLRPNYLDR